ncbi:MULTISPECIES: hypothetical protein [Xenorhabdus]|uniref:hypothetical protein n=1 Tax=Xenorhabdus TaxID=626 RepID=UPI001656ECBE|nr:MULTISPECIES: hypothetical protein [Xenorhabdus]
MPESVPVMLKSKLPFTFGSLPLMYSFKTIVVLMSTTIVVFNWWRQLFFYLLSCFLNDFIFKKYLNHLCLKGEIAEGG